jgi:signal transduction histidine kinase
MRKSFFILLVSIFFLTKNGVAQQYRFHHYRVEQGLPSDVIKAVTQDSLGFFWIATDDGLVKYDGVRFITYKDAVPGQYVKGFLHTKDGKLLAFGDLNAIEIINQIDTVVFKSFLRGERFLSDSTLYFPKAMYEDRNGNIWFAEPKSVVKYDGKSLQRYDFGEENRSSVFVRSFSFFEDKQGSLYVTAYNGNLFKLRSNGDKFLRVENIILSDNISGALRFGNKLLLAARSGLLVSEISNGKFSEAKNIMPVGQVSHLLLAPDSSIYVSTYNEDLYRIRFTPNLQSENLFHDFNGINSSFVSRENDVWVSTDKGLILVQKNLFVLSDLSSQSHFIEGIAFDKKNNKLYYCDKEVLTELNQTPSGEGAGKVIDQNQNHYFQSLAFDGENLWASSRWEVFVYKDSKIYKKLDFSSDGNFVHDLFLDSGKKIWLSQAGTSKVKMIDQSFNITTYEVEGLNLKDINVIREGTEGMYLASSGTNGYLYFKGSNENRFHNISLPIPFLSGTDFNVSDFAIDNQNRLWLATTDGLLKFDHATISKVEFEPEFHGYPVTSVEILDADNILFSNSFGLFRYNLKSNEYWLYDENTGLPSNTITDHGIFVNEDKKVWIGSSFGLAHASGSLLEDKVTRKPFVIETRVNGVATRFNSGVTAPYGSFITLKFSPISFPENRINLQWRYSNDSQWHPVQNQQLELSNLSHGRYKIYFRAKKNTGYSWSDENSVEVSVTPPYWKKTEFVISVLLLVSLIAWASYAISAFIMNKRKLYLEGQINERTHELRIANEELKQRNAELDRFVYSASHDLSAPLKSILGLIRVAKMDKPSEVHKEYLDMMERSVNKLELFILEVVTYSRNARMPLKFESFDFKSFVKGLLQDHEYSDNFKRINFIIENHLNGNIVSDVTRMKIIMNNLLSNAIKFHWVGDGREPFVRISIWELNKTYLLKVTDNGRGIPENHIRRIFEMFYRATEEAQGSGLGLYILKESVLKLGGTVEAESQFEQGTSFTIKLPVPEGVEL